MRTWLLAANYVHEITNVEIYVDHIKCLSPSPEGKSRSQNYVEEQEEGLLNCLLHLVSQINQSDLFSVQVNT